MFAAWGFKGELREIWENVTLLNVFFWNKESGGRHMENNCSVGTGGILIKDHSVLLVKIGYGPYKGMWMIPGGFVEKDESVEQAIIREMKEETGLQTEIKRLVGLRSGTKDKKEGIQTSLYIIFELSYQSGTLMKDENEILDVKYWDVDVALDSDQVIKLSKEIIKATIRTKNGLYQGDKISTKNKYISYKYYIPNNE